MIHPKVCFLILLIFCWVVTASLMAEKTNVGVAIFVADNTCVWLWVGWSCCPPFCVLACPLLQSSVCFPCLEVLLQGTPPLVQAI